MWLIIGISLLIWSVYEFVAGKTWTYREIRRDYEPGLFWVVSIFWFALSLTIIVPSFVYM